MRSRRYLKLRAIAMTLLILVSFPLSLQWPFCLANSNSAPFHYALAPNESRDESRLFFPEDNGLLVHALTTSDSNPILKSAQGVLEPVTVEQRGYSSTGNVSARTDSLANTQQSLPIDTSHDWIASQAEVDVWNLERLYVINGTFDEGYPGYTVNPNGTLISYPLGWSATSYSGDPGQVQQVSYEQSTERYVTVQNTAKITVPGQNIYTHYEGTNITWFQTFENAPYTDQFILSFNYLLLQGQLSVDFLGKYSLNVFIDGTPVYSIDLPTLSKKGTWFDTGSIPISIAAPSGATTFMIGLVINNDFNVDADVDYDGDSIADGATITVCLDDISLISVVSPSCEEVSLSLKVGGTATPIVGNSGTGSGLLVNTSYWITSSIDIGITANTSVTLDYNVRLLNHRFLNSSAAINVAQQGVAYEVHPDESGSLEMFTYLGILGLYGELVLRVYHPVDWQNFTILDPFLADVTSNCTLVSDYVEIPTTLLDRLGWWKILCQSPNYASNGIVERYENVTSKWVDETIFHSYDISRVNISLSSEGDFPILSDAVNFTWLMPNSSIWYKSSTVSGAIEKAESAQVTFGPMNTTAGTWSTIYHWTNGSELAYGLTEFALHHQAALEVVFSENLETVVGQPVTVVLTFRDLENGLLLLNDGAEVVGTWSAGNVSFEPNIVKNWWQADFNTALVGAGDFDITISSAAPFFETTPLIITIKSQFLTSLDTPNGPLQPLIYRRQYNFDYIYSIDYNNSGIDGATVEVSGDGSEWTTITNTGNGHYNLSLIPLGLHDYDILISFSKEGYQNQTDVLSFLVNNVPMEVNSPTSLGGPEFQPLTIEVEVVEADTHDPVSNANVSLTIVPQHGPAYPSANMEELDSGVYSATINMPEAGDVTYNAIITVEKENYELVQGFSIALIPTFDANARLFQIVVNYSSQIIMLAGVLVAIVVGQRAFARKRNRKHALARDIKARFNDANNLLGVVVLHKLSGVPIYSKILKGGFEEGILSAFITAIMHFRTEFDQRREKDDYIIIPISDIVRAVPTENLICAFITITSASKIQEERMITYARAIGMMFDEGFSERPTQVVDTKTIKTFEWMFDDFVDGVLLRPYQVGEKSLPKKLRCIEDVVNTSDGVDSFLLVNLIRLLETCGIDEDDAYLLSMDAIDQEYIVPIYLNNGFSRLEIGDD
jgi:hypothetical protein